MKKAGIAVVVALLTYTIVDIMIWQRIFEKNELYIYSALYHPGWTVMLVGDMVLGALLLLPNWRAVVYYLAALYTLASCGMEDVLYYWLDRRIIPDRLPWLDPAPFVLFKPVTAPRLLMSAAIWALFWLVVYLALNWWESRPRPIVFPKGQSLTPVEQTVRTDVLEGD